MRWVDGFELLKMDFFLNEFAFSVAFRNCVAYIFYYCHLIIFNVIFQISV